MSVFYPSSKSLFVIAILPPLLFSAYIAFPYYQASKQSVPPLKPAYVVLDLPVMAENKLPTQSDVVVLKRSSFAEKQEARTRMSDSLIPQPPKIAENAKNNSKEMIVQQGIDELDLSKLSPELAARVQDAFNQPFEKTENIVSESTVAQSLPSGRYFELEKSGSQFSEILPPLNFQTHNYTSNPNNRWVKVNGKEVNVASQITPEITIMEINPRDVVIEFRGVRIEVPALYEWQG